MATEGHLTPSGFPWMYACATGSCATHVVTAFGSVSWVVSTTSASYNQRKPHVLYLAWLLELALVISPPPLFSYSVYIGCVVLLRVFSLHIQNCNLFLHIKSYVPYCSVKPPHKELFPLL